MKKLLLAICLIAAAGAVFAKKDKKAPAAASAATIKSLPIGADVPLGGVMMQGTDGQMKSLNDAKTEHGLLVMFSCNTCPYVIKAQIALREVMQLSKDLRIGFVVLNSNEAQRGAEDAPERMREYAATQHYDMPYLLDQNAQLADAFGATHTPEVYLFGGSGKLVYKGALEDNPAEPAKSKEHYLALALKALAAGKPINPAETKSIGCSIKRMSM